MNAGMLRGLFSFLNTAGRSCFEEDRRVERVDPAQHYLKARQLLKCSFDPLPIKRQRVVVVKAARLDRDVEKAPTASS